MERIPLGLLQRSYASTALDVAKLKNFTPCDVQNRLGPYKGRIIKIVFDPLHIEDVDAEYRAAGYKVDDELHVIAETESGEILLWGGFNSIYHLKKGEKIVGAFDNIAFEDVRDLTQQFKIKNRKPEIDELIAQLKAKYSST